MPHPVVAHGQAHGVGGGDLRMALAQLGGRGPRAAPDATGPRRDRFIAWMLFVPRFMITW
jgi:hypothetical protein